MAKLRFNCSKCGDFDKRVDTFEEIDTCTCPTCSGPTKRVFISPSLLVKEIIDNSLQVRRVEQIANAPELLQEREAMDRERKKKNDL